jgi:hypothetical protein
VLYEAAAVANCRDLTYRKARIGLLRLRLVVLTLDRICLPIYTTIAGGIFCGKMVHVATPCKLRPIVGLGKAATVGLQQASVGGSVVF